MSLFATLFAITMSMFVHPAMECRHGIHMHVIWNVDCHHGHHI